MSLFSKWPLIAAFLFLKITGACSFLVQRAEQGDVFQNLGTGADYCAERNAVCSVVSLGDLNPSCADGSNAGPSCPSCACSAGERYDNASDGCLASEYQNFINFTLNINMQMSYITHIPLQISVQVLVVSSSLAA